VTTSRPSERSAAAVETIPDQATGGIQATAGSRRVLALAVWARGGTDVCDPGLRDHWAVRVRLRATVAMSVLGLVVGAALVLAAVFDGVIGTGDAAVTLVSALPAVALGLLVLARVPASPAGPALLALVAAPVLTYGVESWALSAGSADPWWGAGIVAAAGIGIWVFHLTGFVLLCLVFPDGLLPGRWWRAMPWLWLLAALGVVAVARQPGDPTASMSGLRIAAVAAALVAFLGTLLGAFGSLVVRYRRGTELVRQQLRWLTLGALSVPALLAAGWVAEAYGASTEFAYTGFLLAMVVLVPAAVAIAILRHDLLDIDRLLGDTAAWLLTSLASAGLFALVVVGVAQLSREASGSTAGVGVAAFVTALLVLPLHRRLHAVMGRTFDRERTVTVAAVRRFVQQVRDGTAEPEEVERVLRQALGDDDLRVLLTAPGSGERVDLRGVPAPTIPAGTVVPLSAREAEVAVMVLHRTSRRRLRLARELAVEARLPIEVSRLRLQLRAALEDARASRARLVEAATEERRRLERDLHDGAQQRILAVGMRLRSAQRRLRTDDPTYQDLDAAVAGLEATVTELRRLAHGIRPSGLDDGLEAAIRSLVADSPVPVEVSVIDGRLSDAVATTAYYIVAEGVTNALKHAGAHVVRVTVIPDGDRLAVEVTDDGCGGARPAFGLSALQDRVVAIGGRVDVLSPVGAGTSIRAVL
jgi:signal transduction histidine kinase